MRLISLVSLGTIILCPFLALAQSDTAASTAAQAATATAADGAEQPALSDLLWIARPIVVFADTPNDPRFQQQLAMLEERLSELEARDVVILIDTDPAARGPLRQELHPRGFNLVLIDKDGAVIQRRPAPTTARELINLIDRTPSRRQETGSRRQ